MTEQIRDQLNLGGETLSLCDYPPFPDQHPRIKIIFPWEPAFRESYANSTACIRGYYAMWEIKDDRLWLRELVGSRNLVGEETLFADWLTRIIRARVLTYPYVENGHAYLYAEELTIQIRRGIVVDTKLEAKLEDRGRVLTMDDLL